MQSVVTAKLDEKTGDILIKFSNEATFQALNFTAYEVWEFRLPDGAVEYSNQNK